MKEIPLTKGKVAIVDDSDYESLVINRWKCDSRGYAAREVWTGVNKQRTVLMHRQILGVTDGKMQVDHINRNQLDNRRENLRVCTVSQNAMNRNVSPLNKIGLKGVGWNPRIKKWHAVIKVGGRTHYLGSHATPELAHAAYAAAAVRLHGEFANIGARHD